MATFPDSKKKLAVTKVELQGSTSLTRIGLNIRYLVSASYYQDGSRLLVLRIIFVWGTSSGCRPYLLGFRSRSQLIERGIINTQNTGEHRLMSTGNPPGAL